MICILIKEYDLNLKFNTFINDDLIDLFNENIIPLDIETTGFHRKYNQIIILGFKYNDKIIQLFAKNQSEEKEILQKFIKLIENTENPLFYTYNGYSFDIPFINARLKFHKIDYKLKNYRNFDIYKIIKAYGDRLNIDNHKLKTIEKYLNIKRTDTISGKENIELFNKYIKNEDINILNKLLLHNYEDIKLLVPVSKILNDFTINEIYRFYPKQVEDNYFIKNIKITNKYMRCVLNNPNNKIIEYYSNYYQITSNKNSIKIELLVKTFKDKNFTLLYPDIIYSDNYSNLSLQQRKKLLIKTEDEILYRNIVNIIKYILNELKASNIF